VPIPVDRSAARALGRHFDEAIELVRNEFEGLDAHRQYRNAFARLLKADPLKRVKMMGTDQRDLFVPELNRVIAEHVPRDGHILDFGAGDGQTFALVASAVPDGTRVSIEEPNPGYLADYAAFLRTQPHLRPVMTLLGAFDEIDAAAARLDERLPEDGTVDLCLALHMLYFVGDLPAGLLRMARFLKPGGALFIVTADEERSYSGRVVDAFGAAAGDGPAPERRRSTIAARRRLLGAPEAGGGAVVRLLADAGIDAGIEVLAQPSRIYGHTLADLIAVVSISSLAEVDDRRKFDVAAELLRRDPESVDLRIEDEGPRIGMWSVSQPQSISIVRRSLRPSHA
jgi:SAM-dependent methyltransferase